MEWFRWYHGTSSDPKFRFIAKRSGQSVAAVIAVWASLLERASKAEFRGDISGFDCEIHDLDLGLEDGSCKAIIAALIDKGLIGDDRITNWEKRQPERERKKDHSTERVRKHRSKLKQDETPDGNDDETVKRVSSVTCNDETQETHETGQEEKRGEERREESPTQGSAGKGKAGSAPGPVPGENRKEPPGNPRWLDDPALEFLELRKYYDERIRQEAPRTGHEAYCALRAARRWPGLNAIYDAIDAYADAYGKAGCLHLVPGFARFLREDWWTELVPPSDARASPGAGKSFQQMAEDSVFAELETMERGQERGQENGT